MHEVFNINLLYKENKEALKDMSYIGKGIINFYKDISIELVLRSLDILNQHNIHLVNIEEDLNAYKYIEQRQTINELHNSKIFKKYTGYSPSEFKGMSTYDEAKKLL